MMLEHTDHSFNTEPEAVDSDPCQQTFEAIALPKKGRATSSRLAFLNNFETSVRGANSVHKEWQGEPSIMRHGMANCS